MFTNSLLQPRRVPLMPTRRTRPKAMRPVSYRCHPHTSNTANILLLTAMDVDAKPSKARIGKKRVDKRRVKKAGIVFRKYSDRIAAKKKKAAPSTSAATA